MRVINPSLSQGSALVINQALQLAQKGLGLSASKQQEIKLWEVVATAKYRLGDELGAIEAQKEMQTLQGEPVWQS